MFYFCDFLHCFLQVIKGTKTWTSNLYLIKPVSQKKSEYVFFIAENGSLSIVVKVTSRAKCKGKLENLRFSLRLEKRPYLLNCSMLKGVFAKNERGYRLTAKKSAFNRY